MKIAIVHPWFPQYRKEFFAELVRQGLASGIEFDIYYGTTPPEWQERGDSATSNDATALPTRFFKVGNRHLNFKSLNKMKRRVPEYDLIIFEQAIRNLETYQVLFSRKSSVAFWGHGRTYTESKNSIEETLKNFITKRGQWFFSYTQGGRESVISAGFPSDRITVLNNTIDSKNLRDSVSAVSQVEVDQFKSRYNVRGSLILFIGGLDASKRIDFLVESARIAVDRGASLTLIVAGDGQLREEIEGLAFEHSWIHAIGPVFGVDKALALRSADAIAIPGRVGLATIDSFASGSPIVTTNWKYHAPEFEYITNGVNGIVTENDEASYAEALIHIGKDSDRLQHLKDACIDDSLRYTNQAMVENFIGGVLRWRKALSA